MKAYPVETRANARRLREQGLGYKRISRQLDVPTSTLQRWLKPDYAARQNAANLERRARYRKPCPKCGALMDGSNGLSGAPKQCAACAAAEGHETRYWTRERIIDCFQRFHRITGRMPTTIDVMGTSPSLARNLSEKRRIEIATAPELPQPWVVQREFAPGGWHEALLAAGLSRAPNGGAGHRDLRALTPASQQVLNLLAIRPMTVAEIAAIRGVAYFSTRETLRVLIDRGLVVRGERVRTRGGPHLYALVK